MLPDEAERTTAELDAERPAEDAERLTPEAERLMVEAEPVRAETPEPEMVLLARPLAALRVRAPAPVRLREVLPIPMP